MLTAITIIILIACVVLAFFILIQNPKGGGLSGSFGGMSTQVMGVQRSSDVMEKGTWISVAVIALMCIASVAFLPKLQRQEIAPPQQQQQQQQSSAPASNSAQPQGQQPAQ